MKNDVTSKYIGMIEAFECDFTLAQEEGKPIVLDASNRLSNDIDLLQELSFLLRYGKLKIVSVD